jgi:hypothetical protein
VNCFITGRFILQRPLYTCLIVRHDFQTQLLHRRKRSYLKPCAHPWAALVLFDSVLVGFLNCNLLCCPTGGFSVGAYAWCVAIVHATSPCSDLLDARLWAAPVLQAAQMSGVREVRLGYERSADEGNGVFVQGREVNHQYDKSSAFLQLAQAYVKRWIDPEVSVTSTLHGLWEIQVSVCHYQQDRYLCLKLNCCLLCFACR